MNSPHKGQWRGALMFSLICAWMDGWVKKNMWGWWFETPSHPSWRSHSNDVTIVYQEHPYQAKYNSSHIILCIILQAIQHTVWSSLFERSVSLILNHILTRWFEYMNSWYVFTINTLRPRQNGSHVPYDILNGFSWMKIHAFHWYLFSQRSNYQYSIIGSDNGLVPVRRQAIIWTNDVIASRRIYA